MESKKSNLITIIYKTNHFDKINSNLKKIDTEVTATHKLAKAINIILPKGIKIELAPQLKALSYDSLTKAAEGKVMKVVVIPLLTHLRKALKMQ